MYCFVCSMDPSYISLGYDEITVIKSHLNNIFPKVLIDIIIDFHIPLWHWTYKTSKTRKNIIDETNFVFGNKILQIKAYLPYMYFLERPHCIINIKTKKIIRIGCGVWVDLINCDGPYIYVCIKKEVYV